MVTIFSDFENDLESIEDDSNRWAEEKEKVESREQDLKNAIGRLQEDIEVFSVVNKRQNEIQHEKDIIYGQLEGFSLQVESIEEELNCLIAETEHSRSVIRELETIGEDVAESMELLEERQLLIDECTARLQEVISRLGLAEFQIENGTKGNSLEKQPADTLRDYMYAHNYTNLDYITYSKDPEWRTLFAEAHPEIPLPPLSQREAFSKLDEYMKIHNYGKEDFSVYSRDPIWQELQKYAYPGSIPTFRKPDMRSASETYKNIVETLKRKKVGYNVIRPYGKQRSSEEIISDLSGGDITGGSCSSLAFAYAGNKAGFEVLDFRDGVSRRFFSEDDSIELVSKLRGVDALVVWDNDDFHGANAVLQKMKNSKEYYFASGKHAAIVRKKDEGYEYLELQHPEPSQNGWKRLDDSVLENRFRCSNAHISKYRSFLMDIDTLKNSQEFLDILGYINTAKENQKKGRSGSAR